MQSLVTSFYRSDTRVALFVLGGWMLLAVAMVCYVRAFGSPLPFFDDLAVLSEMPHAGMPTIDTLFKPFNGHLQPVGRTAYWISWTFANGSVRPLLFVQSLLLILTSLWVMLRLRTIRGQASLDDIVVPLAMLATGHWGQVLWAILFTGIVGTSLVSVLLATLMRSPSTLCPQSFAIVVLLIMFLAFQTAGGLLLAIGFLPFLLLLIIARYQARESYRNAMAVTVIAVGAMLLFALIKQLSRPGASIDHAASAVQKGKALAQALGMCFGGLGVAAWPLAACGIVIIGLTTLLVLLRRDTQSFSKVDSASLLRASLFIPPAMLVMGIASGRGRTTGLAGHYFLLQTPLWVVIAAAWSTLPKSLVQTITLRAAVLGLAMAAGLDFRPNLAFGRTRRAESELLLRDLNAGAHADRIAADHSAYWAYGQTGVYESQLAAIAALGKGPLGRLDCTPSFDFNDLPINDCKVQNATRDGSGWAVTADSRIFLPTDNQIESLRITFEVRPVMPSVYMAAIPFDDSTPSWAQEIPERRNIPLPPVTCSPVTQHFTFNRKADGFVLLPSDVPCNIRILRLEGGTSR
jgi:hypothetical protein